MLIGTYKSNLGEKNRIALPKKFVSELGSKLIITKGYEGSLIIVDNERWDKLISGISNESFVNTDIRDLRRFLIGSAIEIEPDKQGRFVMPEHLKQYAKIIESAVFLGLLDWVEVWDEESWNKKDSMINEKASDVADNVARLLSSK